MAGTTISSVSSVGVVISDAYQNPVTITSDGTIQTTSAYGVYVALGLVGTVVNDGTVVSSTGSGVSMQSGGSVVNGSETDHAATIAGYNYGVSINDRGPGQVTNYGTIGSLTQTARDGVGVDIRGQGMVVNGSATDTGALITGYADGVKFFTVGASVVNYGTIQATATASVSHAATSYGIYLRHGGSVTNGSEADTVATVTGVVRGIEITGGTGTVANFGTVSAQGIYGRGVVLQGGGLLTNGSERDTVAYIGGGNVGVYMNSAAPASLVNFGTIKVAAATGDAGVKMIGGGSVVNGSEADTGALIAGTMRGVFLRGIAPSTVVNFGSIVGGASNGVQLYQGGSVTNGSEADHAALIAGQPAIYFGGSLASSVANFGTLTTNGVGQRAVLMTAGGSVVNGSATDTVATIYGSGDGLCITGGAGVVTNYGTISGNTGVDFTRSGRAAGVSFTGTGTVVNAGTIIGTGGTAIRFGSGTERLVVDAGAVFVGKVVAGTGWDTIELATGGLAAGGAGSVYGLGTNLIGFESVVVDAGAAWTLTGTGSIGAGVVLTNSGALANAGNLTNAGSIVGDLSLAAGSGFVNAVGGVVTGGLTGSSATITNSGSITGAVTLADGANLLVITPGAWFGDLVTGGLGPNTLELAKGTAGGTLTGLGSVITGFRTTLVDSKASWTLAGPNQIGPWTSLVNAGSLINAGSLTNMGALSGGITMAAGSSLDNQAGASVSGGIVASGAGVTVTDSGTIDGAGAAALSFIGAGNRLILNAGAVVLGRAVGGGADNTLELTAGGPGTISGLGTSFAGFSKVVADDGASWTLAGANTIVAGTTLCSHGGLTDAGVLTNAGSIGGGMILAAGASLVNQAGGALTGGVTGGGGAILSNAGSLGGGVSLVGGGNLVVITPGASFGGVVDGGVGANTLELAKGTAAGVLTGLGSLYTGFGTVLVDSKATWSLGGYNAVGASVSITNSGTLIDAGTLTSAGSITGGIMLAAGSVFTNQAGGSVVGTIAASGAGVTVTNAGVLNGNGGAALTLVGGGNRLILGGGAVLVGRAVGGGADNTLELAAGAPGTISGLGSSFTGFSAVQVDAGATWSLTGANTVAAGMTVSGGGTLTDAGALTNAGSIGGGVGLAAGASLVNQAGGALTGGVTGGGGAILSNAGSLGGGVSLVGGGNLVVITPGASFGGVVDGGVGANTLELAKGTAAGVLTGLGSLYTGFGAVLVDSKATWSLGGYNAVGASVSVTNSGTLIDAGTLTSAGSITGGIMLAAGSVFTNQAGGSVVGGVTATGSGVTVANAGAITGGGAVAISFTGGGNLLTLTPGASFGGKVLGGGATNTLELAGAGGGVLSGLGSSITNFASVLVDAGAGWTLAGASTLAAGVKLTNSGTLGVAAGGTLEVAGILNGGVQALGAGARLIVDAGASLGGTFAGGGDATLELAAGSAGTLSAMAAGGGSGSGGWDFSGIGTIAVDKGATWQINGSDTLVAGGSLAVAGTLTGGATLTALGGAQVSANGAGALLRLGGLALQGATVTPGFGGVVEVGAAAGAAIAAINVITVDAGASLSGFGTLSAPLVDNGTVRASGGALAIVGRLSGVGAVSIGAGAALSVTGAVTTAGITFESAGGETLVLGSATGNSAVLAGFGSGDVIDLTSVSGSTLSYSGGVLKVSNSGGTVLSKLTFAGSFSVANFTLASDGQGGTAIGYVADGGGLAGASSLSFVDASAGRQTVATAAPGGTVKSVTGFTLDNADVLDLRAALAGSAWQGDLTRVGGFVTTHKLAGTTSVAVDPTGHGGGATVAVLNGLQASLSDLMDHQAVVFA